MKQKGFTMVELLGVIAILGLLTIIIYPLVGRYMGNSKGELYQVQIKNIERASRAWGAEHIQELPVEEGNFVEVTLQELQDGGYIDEGLKDPKTKKNYNASLVKITITYRNGKLEYQVSGV